MRQGVAFECASFGATEILNCHKGKRYYTRVTNLGLKLDFFGCSTFSETLDMPFMASD